MIRDKKIKNGTNFIRNNNIHKKKKHDITVKKNKKNINAKTENIFKIVFKFQ